METPMPVQRNPFPVYDRSGGPIAGWRWSDERNKVRDELYPTQLEALRALLKYISPPWYVRAWRWLTSKEHEGVDG